MATLPTRLVEVEFDVGVWTDIAADVVQVVTQRGRNRELGAFETGTMAITVRNDGRKYDPDNTAGLYYGKLRPNRRVRFRATYSLTFPIFQGYIDRITQVYGGPNDAAAVFEVSDLFKLLQRAELPRSVYYATANALAPDMWWPLDEPAGSTAVVDVGDGKIRGTVRAGTTLGAAGLVVRDPGSAMQTALGSQGFVVEAVTYPTAGLSGTGAFSVGGWFAAPAQTDPGDHGTLFAQGASTGGIFVQVSILGPGFGVDAGKLEFRIGLVNIVRSTITVADSSVHHWMAVKTGVGGSLKLYIDGVDRTGSAVTDSNTIPAADFAFGTYPAGSGWDLVGTQQHVAVWKTTAVSLAQAQDLNTAGRTPWNGDLSGARMTRILDLSSTPVADRAVDAGSTTLQSTDLGGTVLGYAQKIEETEAGRLFVAADGKLTFMSRQNAETGTFLTSQATLVDADSGAGRGYRATSHDVDEATVITRATVSRDGSVAVTYKDAAAIAEFGLIDEVHDGLLHDTDIFSQAYAEWIVNTHRTPITRVGAVTLELASDPPNMYPDIFGLEIGDRVTYKRTPQNTGATFTLAMRVEAIAHETGGGYWRTTLQLSPFNLGSGGYGTGIWDTSLWDQATWGL